jgi:hypothetical protein
VVGSKDFRTRKIFVGGIPAVVTEGNLSSCIWLPAITMAIVWLFGHLIIYCNGQMSSMNSLHNSERLQNIRSCGTTPPIVLVGLDLLHLIQSRQLMICWPGEINSSWLELRLADTNWYQFWFIIPFSWVFKDYIHIYKCWNCPLNLLRGHSILGNPWVCPSNMNRKLWRMSKS